MSNIVTHNGLFTLIYPDGSYNIFKVNTQPRKSKFAPGSRILSLKENNTFNGFAFVKMIPVNNIEAFSVNDVRIWKSKLQDPKYKKYIELLISKDKRTQEGVRYESNVVCRVCNRNLTTPESIESGIGPVCETKI